MHNSAVALLALLLLSACQPTARDGGDDRSRVLTVDSVPVLVIAGTAATGDLTFGSAAGGTVLTNGTIVIGDGLDLTVRFFDHTGAPRLSVGRSGEGPGEFSHIDWLRQCGMDSVFVWDSDLQRMTVIDESGSFVRTFRVPADPALAPASIINCSRSGSLVAIGTPRDIASVWEHYSAPLWLVDARGTIVRSFGDVHAFEGRPLGKVSSIAISEHRVYVGTKDSLYVDAYDRDGNAVTPLRVADSLRPPTSRHYELAIDLQASRLARVDDRRMLKELMLQSPMPEYMPAYAELFVDPMDRLWVELSVLGDPGTWLRSFQTDGTLIADMQLPRYMKVFEVGADYILGTYDDVSGEPYVAVYRLR